MTITNATWPTTRAAAETRLKDFVGKAGRQYRAERNFDRGPGQHSSVSGLSPYIRHRVVSEAEVVAAVLKQNTFSAAEKFVQEVYWRTYWKGWLEQRPGVWTRYLRQLEEALQETQGASAPRDLYERAQQGQTGIEPFDAWAQELVATGYLHNHARMWFASIWIFTLKLPWVLGADFFLRHLLDGDPASNTLSWRWVAGLHTRGKTYLATANNIEKYAAERFFSDGAPAGLPKLARRADALLEEDLPPAVMPALPEPVQAVPDSGLLLTEEDLQLDVPLTPHAVALWMPDTMHPQAASEQVQAFKADIGRDALERAATRWPDTQVEPARSTVPQIVQWAEQQGLRQIYMAYIPQGYVRAQQAELARALADRGCALQTFVREYDRLAWPHAGKGFFQLKKRIPNMLATLGLS